MKQHHHAHTLAALLMLVGSATAQPPASAASATLVDSAGLAKGTARFTDTPQGLQIDLDLQGLPPGQHAVHVHRHGECAPGPDPAENKVVPFGAAGPHFDPTQSRNHGDPSAPADQVHGGDLPNLAVGPDGRARLTLRSAKLTARPGDKTSVLGRSLVVHERPDDYRSDPAGNAGPRIACGVIDLPGRTPLARHTFDGANVFPEGIAVDEKTGVAYVGSSSEGHLYKLVPGRAKAELLALGGSPGREAALGLKLDAQGRLWVAGGASGKLAVVDAATGRTQAVLDTPSGPQTFLNDVVLAADGFAYVTDSARPVLFRAAHAGPLPRQLEAWLDLGATPVRYRGDAPNLNGIVATSDGRWLLAVQTSTGQLWRIDPRSREVREIPVDGGSLLHGDGLLLQGRSLFVVRNVESELVRLELDEGYTRARVAQRTTGLPFKHPTTLAAGRGAGLLVVNGQLERQKNPPPLLPFDVIEVGRP
ncbi:superoxide dismutase family protein [Caldimonas brevitalea]|uniref:Superoxide dismutase, Cu-Zn family n=1 Tax=Caldimonas brevitalea TaxID=413882 RepID=A0A0G3BVY6_9BURK|nr:superoxide dismutase family protein [Caldimonas brevitalea]AKJ32193.1 superoxide dismutase, Cu-Zn family [Caldimonas brevitalea]